MCALFGESKYQLYLRATKWMIHIKRARLEHVEYQGRAGCLFRLRPIMLAFLLA